MLDFIEFANRKVYTQNQEMIRWTANDPYLFSRHWRGVLAISSFGNCPLKYYKELGGKVSEFESEGRYGKGIITTCVLKGKLGYYNMSNSKAVFKNTVYGANVIIPYFTGASEHNIYRMLNAFPVYIFYQTINYNELIACQFKDLSDITEELILKNGYVSRLDPVFRKNRDGETIACFNGFSGHCDEFDILEYSWEIQ